jgi:hypothetical protein
MSLKVSNILPSSAIVPPISSSSAHVLKARMVEVPASVNGTYSYATNSRIEFQINSPSDYIDFVNSYVRLDLTCDLTIAGVDAPTKYLAEGGIHSCFRKISVETSGGTLIQKIDRYNKYYSMLSGALHSPEYVDQNLAREADSSAYETVGEDAPGWVALSAGTVTYDFTGGASEGLLTGSSTLFTRDLKVGDMVMGTKIGAASTITRVESITSDTVANCIGGVDLAAGSTLYVMRKNVGSDPARKRVANTDASVVAFQPLIPFLQMTEWIPLFLIRGGLRIFLDLERPEFCLAAPSEPGTGFAGANVQMSNVYYVCRMIQPDEQLSQQYLMAYRGAGLHYHMLGAKHFLDNISAGATGQQNIRLDPGVRSARFYLGRLQNIRAETVTSATATAGKSTYTCDSIAQGLKAGLSEWGLEAGSERFPMARPIDCTSVDNAEMLAELQHVMQSMGSPLQLHRFKQSEWVELPDPYRSFDEGLTGGKNDSNRLILAVNMSRDASPFAGVDLSLNPLHVQPNLSAASVVTDMDGSNSANSAIYLHSFVFHDQTISLSQDVGVQVRL